MPFVAKELERRTIRKTLASWSYLTLGDETAPKMGRPDLWGPKSVGIRAEPTQASAGCGCELRAMVSTVMSSAWGAPRPKVRAAPAIEDAAAVNESAARAKASSGLFLIRFALEAHASHAAGSCRRA